MDHQGTGRIPSARDARRQPSWPPPEDSDGTAAPRRGTGAQPVRQPGYGYGADAGPGAWNAAAPPPGNTGPRHAGPPPGTGPWNAAPVGTGSWSTAKPETGAWNAAPAAGTGSWSAAPVRGFPPSREPTTPAQEASGPWQAPGEPRTGPNQPVLDFPGPGGRAAGGASPNYTGPNDTGPNVAGPNVTGPDPVLPPDAAFTAPAAEPVTGPVRRRRAAPARRPLRSRPALLAAIVAGVLVIGLVGYKFLYEPRVNAPVPSTLKLPTTAARSPGFDQALGKWQHISTRAEDPTPLTIEGLYPPQFELNGSSYTRTAASETKSCTSAVYGSSLQSALQSGKCSQALRASYISGNGTMMGTIGVVNLVTATAAQKAGQATGPQEIVAPLTGKKGPTSKLGHGTGVVQAEIKGHYLILILAEFTDQKSPSTTAQRDQLEQFGGNLVTGSANINLSTRMLTGKD